MKNILKTLIFAICILTIGGCEDDIDPVVAVNGFALRSADAASLTLIPQNNDESAITLNWDRSANGSSATVSNYVVEIAESGTNFANPVLANSGNNVTTGTSYVFTVKELNALVNQLPGYQCEVEMSVDIRVKSTLGEGFYNEFTQYSSNVVTVNVTPYSLELPLMSFASSSAEAATAPKLAASGVLNTDYEGYMYLEPGSYKFYKANTCGEFTSPVVYGTSGTNTIAVDGGDFQVATAGFYKVTADTATGTFAVNIVTWGIFGTARLILQGVNTPMIYNQTTKLWSITGTFYAAKQFKFRNNVGAQILGIYNPATIDTPLYAGPVLSYYTVGTGQTPLTAGGDLTMPGPAASVPIQGNFTITLDLNSPRNYTYTATQNF